MNLRAAVLVFPGSNCDRDLAVALERAGAQVAMVWHKETALPAGLDLVAIPGGFSFGDYLRCGAIAARSPIVRAVVRFAEAGGHVLGVCNGFQVLIEAGLLPGALMRNAGLKFVCAPVSLTVETTESAAVTVQYANGSVAVVHYTAEGAPDLPKERIEMSSGGRSWVLDDFVSLSGAATGDTAGKGHAELLAHVVRAARGIEPFNPGLADAYAAQSVALAAVESIAGGSPVAVVYRFVATM